MYESVRKCREEWGRVRKCRRRLRKCDVVVSLGDPVHSMLLFLRLIAAGCLVFLEFAFGRLVGFEVVSCVCVMKGVLMVCLRVTLLSKFSVRGFLVRSSLWFVCFKCLCLFVLFFFSLSLGKGLFYNVIKVLSVVGRWWWYH